MIYTAEQFANLFNSLIWDVEKKFGVNDSLARKILKELLEESAGNYEYFQATRNTRLIVSMFLGGEDMDSLKSTFSVPFYQKHLAADMVEEVYNVLKDKISLSEKKFSRQKALTSWFRDLYHQPLYKKELERSAPELVNNIKNDEDDLARLFFNDRLNSYYLDKLEKLHYAYEKRNDAGIEKIYSNLRSSVEEIWSMNIDKSIIDNELSNNLISTDEDLMKFMISSSRYFYGDADVEQSYEERLKHAKRNLLMIEKNFSQKNCDLIRAILFKWKKLSEEQKRSAHVYMQRLAFEFQNAFKDLPHNASNKDIALTFLKYAKYIVTSGSRNFNLILKNIDSIIRKKSISSVKPEAPKKAPLERYAFADQRNDVPKEKNTELENKIFNDLQNHFFQNERMSAETVKAIKNILDNGWYKSVFREPTKGKVLYRGMRVDKAYLERALGDKFKEDLVEDTIEGNLSFESEKSSSWSFSYESALDFATPMSSKNYAIMLIADVNDNESNFLVGSDALYKLEGIEEFEYEKEAIALGNVKCRKVIWRKGSLRKRS